MFIAIVFLFLSASFSDTLRVLIHEPGPPSLSPRLFGFALEVGSMPDTEYVADYLTTHANTDFS